MNDAESVAPEVEIVVAGIKDEVTTATVEHIVRGMFSERRISGKWVVGVAPSDTRGRWDLQLQGPSHRHVVSFTTSIKTLPEVLTTNLKRALEQIAP